MCRGKEDRKLTVKYWNMANVLCVRLGNCGDTIRFVVQKDHFDNSIGEKEVFKPIRDISTVI